ncbi:hypothetical protein [Roseospirillum parvum]|uniref:Uncharacterized protein n=1 Tax=Roseospirillum parvum TaxID=83401 RepID=A0A1G8DUG0_9PROT|nr:hypothetical protein [Roseospirillum parvum]SDH61307.1 hypothetical protein SAMN05421742_108123 [Roseospirillum parvum]
MTPRDPDQPAPAKARGLIGTVLALGGVAMVVWGGLQLAGVVAAAGEAESDTILGVLLIIVGLVDLFVALLVGAGAVKVDRAEARAPATPPRGGPVRRR